MQRRRKVDVQERFQVGLFPFCFVLQESEGSHQERIKGDPTQENVWRRLATRTEDAIKAFSRRQLAAKSREEFRHAHAALGEDHDS